MLSFLFVLMLILFIFLNYVEVRRIQIYIYKERKKIKKIFCKIKNKLNNFNNFDQFSFFGILNNNDNNIFYRFLIDIKKDNELEENYIFYKINSYFNCKNIFYKIDSITKIRRFSGHFTRVNSCYEVQEVILKNDFVYKSSGQLLFSNYYLDLNIILDKNFDFLIDDDSFLFYKIFNFPLKDLLNLSSESSEKYFYTKTDKTLSPIIPIKIFVSIFAQIKSYNTFIREIYLGNNLKTIQNEKNIYILFLSKMFPNFDLISVTEGECFGKFFKLIYKKINYIIISEINYHPVFLFKLTYKNKLYNLFFQKISKNKSFVLIPYNSKDTVNNFKDIKNKKYLISYEEKIINKILKFHKLNFNYQNYIKHNKKIHFIFCIIFDSNDKHINNFFFITY